MAPDDPLPAYTYVPGGPHPHPTGSPLGHSFGRFEEPATPIPGDAWADSPAFVLGVRLFNAGYYWEAHEAWEALWHAHGRSGPTADVLKALIKLAAAGVKVREHQPHGITTHARRAAELFESVRAEGHDHRLGLDLAAWADAARRISAHPPSDPTPPDAPAVPVLGLRIEPA